jgi:hypothetical protein
LKNRLRTVIGVVVGFAAVLGLMASPAQAVTFNVDYATIDISGGMVATMQNDLVGGGTPHGALVTTAYLNAAHTLYTYEAKFIPVVNEISIISTSFVPLGLTGSVGWSFQDATIAGALSGSTAFASLLGAGGLAWERDLAQDFWFANQQMRFFFQSTLAPGTAQFGVYNQSNASIGSAVGLAPVAAAEPMTLVLLSSGLAGAGLWARWGRRDA